ncbi:hypothetical protein [Wenjunlia tyrosinilytica]|uniref:PBP domain-containing protein n=1 Tax=Wenjunlia tyrosinilytica TaxID=1544741 RepID=A0A917ZJL2_9ACTN|nr:hypothetical protein [Wenjunlia tyrosinilytica]GGO83184.1 hypothetical protein GCM10012280_11550 [Wenjunlia tyrosinilytica]
MRRPRLICAVAALLAAVGLVVLPPPGGAGQASAAGGGEDSAVTVTGRKGRYDDFSKLKVTVHQTRNLRAQGIRITWTGGRPTSSTNFEHNYLQIMQCWGDKASGPEREQCQFGGSEIHAVGGQFSGSNLVGMPAGSSEYDPKEKKYTYDDVQGAGWVPFRPVRGKPTTTPTDQTYFTKFTTNEQPYDRTGADGTGDAVFEAQTGVESPHLGCGEAMKGKAARPKARACWLVIVPRGEHEPGGGRGSDGRLQTSPLSASNWAQRMTVKLEFLPIGRYCPIGQAERPTLGSEMVSDAMTSWQPALCTSGRVTYGYQQSGDGFARGQVANPLPGSPGLAFTSAPVTAPEGAKPVVHAPVAVSGLGVAFFIEDPEGALVRRLRLNPRLIAKLLTSSYQRDVPDGLTQPHMKGNPESLVTDAEFVKLNPKFKNWSPSSFPQGLIMPQGDADSYRLLWQWLQSDREAREFLGGKKDPWGTKLNPFFKELRLDHDSAVNTFPKADPSKANATPPPDPVTYGVIDLRPYVNSLHDGALHARKGDSGQRNVWDANSTPPKFTGSLQPPGKRFQLALVDAASAARYGLPTAQLKNGAGQWVAPTPAALLKGVAAMKPGAVRDVLELDPARTAEGAYPLTEIAYAAASTGLSAKARKDYANLVRYAVGHGQVPGIGPGLLPPGYAPLPQRLRRQALSAAARLQAGVADAGNSGGASGGTTAGASGGSGSTGGGSGSTAGGSAGGASPKGGQSAPPPNGGGKSPGPDGVTRAGASTPQQALGAVRWVLLAVLVLGGAGALLGPLLMRRGALEAVGAALRRWR